MLFGHHACKKPCSNNLQFSGDLCTSGLIVVTTENRLVEQQNCNSIYVYIKCQESDDVSGNTHKQCLTSTIKKQNWKMVRMQLQIRRFLNVA